MFLYATAFLSWELCLVLSVAAAFPFQVQGARKVSELPGRPFDADGGEPALRLASPFTTTHKVLFPSFCSQPNPLSMGNFRLGGGLGTRQKSNCRLNGRMGLGHGSWNGVAHENVRCFRRRLDGCRPAICPSASLIGRSFGSKLVRLLRTTQARV